MEFAPNPQQVLFLWCVVVEPANTPINKLPYKNLKPALRKELEQIRWIQVAKVSFGKRSKCMVASLTEQGWYGLERNLNAPIAKGGATAKVLQTVLAAISRQIGQGRLALAELFAATTEPAAVMEDEIVKRRVYEACGSLVGNGVYGVRIRLADLRPLLADVPREQLDRVLSDLEKDQAAALFRLDDPREIGSADDAAAIPNRMGSPRHVLYLSQPS